MRERDIEEWLVRQVRELGGIADKFVSPGNPGVPDRLIIIPGGHVIFVELKTEIGRMSNIQKWQRERYRKMGADFRIIKGKKEAEEFINEIRAARLSENSISEDNGDQEGRTVLTDGTGKNGSNPVSDQ